MKSNLAKTEYILSSLAAVSHAKCEHVTNVDIFYFALTCDIIGDPEVSKIKLLSTTLEELSTPFNTSHGEGLRITRPGGGHILPPCYLGSRNARNTKLGWWVGPHKNFLWCKFADPRSTSSRSNDAINAKFSYFWVKRAALCFSRSRAQTKTDSFDPQKGKMRNELGYLE